MSLTSSQNCTDLCQSIIQLIEQHYVQTALIKPITQTLQDNLARGEYHNISTTDLATRLTQDLQAICHDRHVYVALPKAVSNQDWATHEQKREIKQNFGFTEMSLLEGNIGYLKILEFMHPDRGIATAIAAMTVLQHTNALLIDLRGNGGGYGGLAEYLISYFFTDEPQLLSTTHFRDSSQTFQTSTLPFVVGLRRVDLPLYILVDQKTGSAAEWFTYTLQSLGKCVVIGETTLGAANRNAFFSLEQGLKLSLSVGMPISAVTNGNWEGVGIIPDLACLAEQAKPTAHQIAHENSRRSIHV